MEALTIGHLIRQKRESLGHTQTKLAHDLSWDAAKLCRIERGERTPSVADLRQVCLHLGIDRVLAMDLAAGDV